MDHNQRKLICNNPSPDLANINANFGQNPSIRSQDSQVSPRYHSGNPNIVIYQRTIGPVLLTRVLRICSVVIEEKKFTNIEFERLGPKSMNDVDLWYS